MKIPDHLSARKEAKLWWRTTEEGITCLVGSLLPGFLMVIVPTRKNEKSSEDAPDYVLYECRVLGPIVGRCNERDDFDDIDYESKCGLIDDAELDYRG